LNAIVSFLSVLQLRKPTDGLFQNHEDVSRDVLSERGPDFQSMKIHLPLFSIVISEYRFGSYRTRTIYCMRRTLAVSKASSVSDSSESFGTLHKNLKIPPSHNSQVSLLNLRNPQDSSIHSQPRTLLSYSLKYLRPIVKMTTTARPVQSVSNSELYNRWAKVYDTDGNILQAIDDHLIPSLLTSSFSLLPAISPITITELGAGTGRNTVKLLSPTSNVQIKAINALDLSPGMLEVAKKRCQDVLSSVAAQTSTVPPSIQFLEFDALNPAQFPSVQKLEGQADLVISTLVLEHLPSDVFFKTVASLLKPSGGILVLTNMHAEMGRKGQAGFVDESIGEKVRGISFNYEVKEVVDEGKKFGFELVGEMGEREVRESDLGEGKLLGPRGNKWTGTRVWFGCVMRFGGSS
jgi:SAM-dependent methyltransferase